MTPDAWVRVQRVAEWLALADPQHQLESLLAQAKALYSQANDLTARAILLRPTLMRLESRIC